MLSTVVHLRSAWIGQLVAMWTGVGHYIRRCLNLHAKSLGQH